MWSASTIICAAIACYFAVCSAAPSGPIVTSRSAPPSLGGWHHQTSTYGLDLPNYAPPYTKKSEFEDFLIDLEHHILEKEVAVGGNLSWEWPYGHFGFQCINGIELALFEHEDALLPLNLQETKAITPLLRKWVEEFSETADIPSVQMLQVSWKNTDDTISFGSIYMPDDRRSLAIVNSYV